MKRGIVILALMLSLIPSAVWGGPREKGKVMSGKNVRESVIAGSWYPGDPARLTKDIKGLSLIHI